MWREKSVLLVVGKKWQNIAQMTTEHLKFNILNCKEGMGRVYVLVVCSRSGVSSSLQQNISRLAPAGGAAGSGGH